MTERAPVVAGEPRPTGAASRSTRAFTLIEILLAVAVFAIVLVAIHVVFHGALRLRNKVTARLEAAVPLEHALAIIQHDLAGIVAPGTNMAGPLQTTATGVTTRVIGQVSPFFYTSVGTLDAEEPWGDLVRVTYRLAEPTNDSEGLELFRSVTRNLLAVIEDEPEEQFLLGGVESLTFLYYDGTQWRYDWDSSTDETVLPGAIRVELLLTRALTNRLNPEPVVLVVPLMVQPDTNSVSQTTEAGT